MSSAEIISVIALSMIEPQEFSFISKGVGQSKHTESWQDATCLEVIFISRKKGTSLKLSRTQRIQTLVESQGWIPDLQKKGHQCGTMERKC